ncbi:MAG: hypothetical protein WC178_05440 [Candidatus Paceibacterota bacterium]
MNENKKSKEPEEKEGQKNLLDLWLKKVISTGGVIIVKGVKNKLLRLPSYMLVENNWISLFFLLFEKEISVEEEGVIVKVNLLKKSINELSSEEVIRSLCSEIVFFSCVSDNKNKEDIIHFFIKIDYKEEDIVNALSSLCGSEKEENPCVSFPESVNLEEEILALRKFCCHDKKIINQND